jgi:hypothetical protein
VPKLGVAYYAIDDLKASLFLTTKSVVRCLSAQVALGVRHVIVHKILERGIDTQRQFAMRHQKEFADSEQERLARRKTRLPSRVRL